MSDPQATPPAIPTVKDRLRELILSALRSPYTSESCKDAIKTGNHYQSIKLGDTRTAGFRSDRAEFLDQINFANARVLDLGANLGEMSRSARERGAVLVDGFEYDPFFIETGRLINAFNDVTRVSFYQRDITNPAIYTEHYDIVLAFSVFTYVHRPLEQIAAITDGIFVLETHKLENNLESGYLDPVARYFPHYRILGQSDWGRSFDAKEKRAVIVFAKTGQALAAGLKATATAALASTLQRRFALVDVPRTCLQENFFARFEQATGAALLERVARLRVSLRALAGTPDLKELVYSGWSYWLLFLKGYLQYRRHGFIGRGNIYCDYLLDYYVPRAHDPGLCSTLASPAAVIQRVAWRFQDLESLDPAVAPNQRQATSGLPPVITLTEPPMPDQAALAIYEVGQEPPLRAALVDGWHRLFAAKVFGGSNLRCEVITTFRIPPGAIFLVVSKGDDALLQLAGCTGWHFPRTENGAYAGHHPADSAEAIAHLESLRAQGARYLLFPSTSFWWLDSYPEFREHLDTRYRRAFSDANSIVFDLNR
jgi:hypothetical protein